MELLEPLAVHHAGLATRHVLDAPGCPPASPGSPLFQHPEEGYPVHPRRLHDHGLHAALEISQSARRYRSAVQGPKTLAPAASARPAGTAYEMAGGAPHRYPPRLGSAGTARRFCAALACAHHSLHDYRVGVSPELESLTTHSLPNGDRRPVRASPSDAVARLHGPCLLRQSAPTFIRSSSRQHVSP